MNNKIQILIAIVISTLITFYLTRKCSDNHKIISAETDTSTAVTTKIYEVENSFSAIQSGRIKKILIDSINNIYKNKLFKIEQELKQRNAVNTKKNQDEFIYLSEIDTVYIATDSTGFIMDSIRIKSTVYSNEPLPDNLIHTLTLNHKSFNKEKEIITTITNKEIIEKKKSIFSLLKIIPNVSVGYGLINKTFDVYAGIGIIIEL